MDALAAPRQLDQPVATAVTIITLLAGATVSAVTSGHEVAASMFLFAMLVASRTNRRGLVIGSALFATLSHLLPTLFDAGIWQGSTSLLHVAASQLLWATLYWMSAALLIWDPRHRNLNIAQIHEAFAHAPAAMALLDTNATIVHANSAFTDLIGKGDEPLVGSRLDQLHRREDLGRNPHAAKRADVAGECPHPLRTRLRPARRTQSVGVGLCANAARLLRRGALCGVAGTRPHRTASRSTRAGHQRIALPRHHRKHRRSHAGDRPRRSHQLREPEGVRSVRRIGHVADRREAAAVHPCRRPQRIRARTRSHQHASARDVPPHRHPPAGIRCLSRRAVHRARRCTRHLRHGRDRRASPPIR